MITSKKKQNNMFTYKLFLEKKINSPGFEKTIPKELIEISEIFSKHNKQLYIVGGAIRDYLQGKKPHDYDMVTNALPEESKEILKNWNVSDEQGKNFGVLRIYTDNEPLGYELATFRKDISKGRDVKGNDKKVEIGNHITIEDDVKRRDLTINALFYDIQNKQIVDLVGGISDLKNHIIRSVGDPFERFKEDRLRILRIFRFSARTGNKIDKNTALAIRHDNKLKGISSKDDVSQERITEEFYKMMEYSITNKNEKMFIDYLKLLNDYKMYDEMFPDINVNIPTHLILNSSLSVEDIEKIWLSIFLDNVERTKDMYKKLIDLKFPSKHLNVVFFLKDYKQNVNNIEKCYYLNINNQKYNIKRNLLITYANYFHILNKPLIEYLYSAIKTDGNKLKEEGFKGKEISIEKEKREIERYKKEFLK